MKPIVCVGAALIDDSFFSLETPSLGTSNPSTHLRSAGGVARNIAQHLAQLGQSVELVAHFGRDADGEWLEAKCRTAGIGLALAHRSDVPTGHFASILSPGGELFTGAADTQCEDQLTPAVLVRHAAALAEASCLVLDCNLSRGTLEWLLAFGRTHGIPSIVEPVSVAKAARLVHSDISETLLVTPNSLEITSLAGNIPPTSVHDSIERLLARGVRYLWMREGRDGSLLASRDETITMGAPNVNVFDSTGAGDAALAGWIYAWLRQKNPRECLRYGHAMAELILQTRGANAECLRPELLESIASLTP